MELVGSLLVGGPSAWCLASHSTLAWIFRTTLNCCCCCCSCFELLHKRGKAKRGRRRSKADYRRIRCKLFLVVRASSPLLPYCSSILFPLISAQEWGQGEVVEAWRHRIRKEENKGNRKKKYEFTFSRQSDVPFAPSIYTHPNARAHQYIRTKHTKIRTHPHTGCYRYNRKQNVQWSPT